MDNPFGDKGFLIQRISASGDPAQYLADGEDGYIWLVQKQHIYNVNPASREAAQDYIDNLGQELGDSKDVWGNAYSYEVVGR